MFRFLPVAALVGTLLLSSALPQARSIEREAPLQLLVPLARVGPWSSVSSMIGFGDRLWFVNSVKFRDHNSADAQLPMFWAC